MVSWREQRKGKWKLEEGEGNFRGYIDRAFLNGSCGIQKIFTMREEIYEMCTLSFIKDRE